VAVIVPAFNSSGVPSLPVGAAIQSYYAWHFVTSDTPGGFRDLAMRLWPLKPIPNNLGMAPVAYQTAPSQSTLQPQMLIGGALVGLTSGSPAALPQEVQDHFAPVRPTLDPVFQHDADGRPLVRLPLYGEPWLDPGTTEPAWVKELNDDPRYRGVAGLGMWAGIEWQDRIVEAASKQLGSFYVAARRIRQLTAGLAATRSLWDRRLPADEMHRLQVLGLAMPRLATAQGGSALDHVAAADRPMPRAFFSSAARRIFRPGTARARQAQPGALTPAVLFERMNTCRSDSRDHPGGLLHTDTLCDGSLDEVIGAIEDGGHFQISGVAREGSVVLDDEERRAREEAGLGPARWFDAVSVFEEHPDVWGDLFVDAHAPYRTRPCETNGANLSRLSDILQAAFNPHGDDAFVIQRVRATIKGLDDQPLAPPELCLDLQIPAWKFLNEFAKDWFLPGLAQLQILKPDEIGQLIVDREKDPVIAATTNGCFTDAFLVGINQQALTELRWRNVPVATGCTPLRRFWEPLRPEPPVSDGEPGEDILGFHRWSSDTLLGDAQHETPEAQGDNLVLIFKSQLWRRYPETLIYLLPKKPAPNDEPDWAAAHITPNLHVEIERDVVAFGFVQSSAILETHWVVIEQVPRGFSFYNLSKPAGNQANQQLDSSQFAREAFAQAVRVLILGTELKPQP
jgi:hypothetical protein